MQFLFLMAIAGFVAWMWNRVEQLERQVRWLNEGLDALNHAPPAAIAARPAPMPKAAAPEEAEIVQAPERERVPEPAPKPAPARTFVPAVAPKAYPERQETEKLDAQPARYSLENLRPKLDFEDIFGRLLPIWAGGIALAIAGFFLVRWSIENGLLNENVRVALGFIFGITLIAGAEIAHRFERLVADERIRQALAGAGLATLYASFYLAGTHYGLIGGTLAFAGLAGVTALAILLSFRFGLPSAVLGLVGGFAAPALAGATDPNLPMLAAYLALVTGGLTFTGAKQNRNWLGLAALAGGLGWGVLMLLSGPMSDAGILALGGYLLMAGTMLPSLMGKGVLGRIGRIAACAVATLQIAILVDQTGYSMLAWGAYVLLAAAIAVLGWQHQRLREAGAMAAGLSVLLIAAWPDPSGASLAVISAAMAAIFIGAPLAHVLREKAQIIDWAQLALYPLSLIGALCVQLWVPLPEGQHMLLALASIALAIPPAIAAWLNWSKDDEPLRQAPFAAFTASAALVIIAGLLATTGWAAPFVTLAVAAGLFALLRQRGEIMPNALQWAVALGGGVLMLATAEEREFEKLVGYWFVDGNAIDALRWLAAGLPFAMLALLRQARSPIQLAQLLGVLCAYGATAQVISGDWLPLALAAGVLILAWRMRWRAAHATAIGLSALWALPPIVLWSIDGISALSGDPMMSQPSEMLHMMTHMLLPLIAAWIGSLLLSPRFFERKRDIGWALGGGLALIAAHYAFKTLFGIADMEQFITLGMAERTVWQALLALPAIAMLTMQQRWNWQHKAGMALGAVSLTYFAIFTLAWHNPLWNAQAVGTVPIANLLLPAYALAIAALLSIRSTLTGFIAQARPVFDGAAMVLIGLLALSELRHIFAGSILTTTDMTQYEDLLRSILAIGLALAFLGWGAVRKQRSWRIGSLVLILLAVAKVFLFDAAGLEGLARIASFMALGLCLIGIGWFYTRQLKSDIQAQEDAAS